MRYLNQGGGSGPAWIWQRGVIPALVGLLVARRMQVHGPERLDLVPPGAPRLLVATHRTFFDLFILGWFLIRHPRLTRRVNFPVRSNFFYERPLGLFLSAVFTRGSMVPPLLRFVEDQSIDR